MFYIFSESDTYMHIRICLGQFLKTNFSLHFLNIFKFLAKIALRELFYRFCAWEEKKQAFNNIGMTGKSDEPRMPTKYFRYGPWTLKKKPYFLMKNTNDYFNLWRSQKR